MLTLESIRGGINGFRMGRDASGGPAPTCIRISRVTLGAIEDRLRTQELESAQKSDRMMEAFGGSYFEHQKQAEQLKRPYATDGDQLFGLRIVIDDTLPEGDFRIE